MGSGAARGATNARPNFGLHYAQGVHLSHGVPHGVPHGGDLLHGVNQSTFTPCVTPLWNNS